MWNKFTLFQEAWPLDLFKQSSQKLSKNTIYESIFTHILCNPTQGFSGFKNLNQFLSYSWYWVIFFLSQLKIEWDYMCESV